MITFWLTARGFARAFTIAPLNMASLATLPDDAPQHKLLYKIQHQLLQEGVSQQQREAEIKKLQGVVEKLTAPANRIGTLLDKPAEGIEFMNISPRSSKISAI